MKLRSGAVLPYAGKKELPIVLQEELDSTLLDFKELLEENKEVAIKILRMIANARSFSTCSEISHIMSVNDILDHPFLKKNYDHS